MQAGTYSIWSANGEIRKVYSHAHGSTAAAAQAQQVVEGFGDMQCNGDALFNIQQANAVCGRMCEQKGKYYTGNFDADERCECVGFAYAPNFSMEPGETVDDPYYFGFSAGGTEDGQKVEAASVCAKRADCGYAAIYLNNGFSLHPNKSDIQSYARPDEPMFATNILLKDDSTEMIKATFSL